MLLRKEQIIVLSNYQTVFSMGTFKQEYTQLVDAIISYAIVMPPVKIEEDQQPPLYYYTDKAAWDTGAQFSFISPRLVESLGLKPFGKASFLGIGGDQTSDTYLVHIGLSDGKLITDLEVYCADIDDYDLLLGMDVINQTDFLITNADHKTTFQFRTPSLGGVEL